jgi:hypothetical protein
MSKLFVHVRLPYFSDAMNDAPQYEECFSNMQIFLKNIKSQGINDQIVFVLNHMWEITFVKDLNFLHDFFKNKLKNYNVDFFILYSLCADDRGDLPKNIIKYNFFQSKTVHATTIDNQQTAKKWNKSKFKGLLLTGKAHKYQRLIPLKYLLDNNLLNETDMEWSFFYYKEYAEDIKKILNINNKELQHFVSSASRNPDNIEVSQYGNLFSYDGFPYSRSLYSDTSWSLISETHLNMPFFWVTEKTYRAIINKHPFIFFGQERSEEYLRSQGFKTFEYCFPINYDNITSNEHRFEAAFKNICHIRENWKNLDFKRIKNDVNHNYNVLFNSVVNEQRQLIKKLKFNDGDKICDILLYDLFHFGHVFGADAEVSTVEDVVNGKKSIIYYYWDIR